MRILWRYYRANTSNSGLVTLVSLSTEMTGCCVPLCTGSTQKGLRVFRFPRDPERRKKWESQVKRDCWKATDTSKICERHFDDEQFEKKRQDGRLLLKRTAVPTLFDFRRKECSEEAVSSCRQCMSAVAGALRAHASAQCDTRVDVKSVQCDLQSKRSVCTQTSAWTDKKMKA